MSGVRIPTWVQILREDGESERESERPASEAAPLPWPLPLPAPVGRQVGGGLPPSLRPLPRCHSLNALSCVVPGWILLQPWPGPCAKARGRQGMQEEAYKVYLFPSAAGRHLHGPPLVATVDDFLTGLPGFCLIQITIIQ